MLLLDSYGHKLSNADSDYPKRIPRSIGLIPGRKKQIESRGIVLSMFSENKGAYQLCGYCAADLHLCFGLCKNKFSHNTAQRLYAVCRGNLEDNFSHTFST